MMVPVLPVPFEIGGTYYLPMGDAENVTIPCPVCAGTCRLTVILGDGEHVSVPCEGCDKGFNSPRGTTTEWQHNPRVKPFTIASVVSFDKTFGEPRWYVESVEGERVNLNDLFLLESVAMAVAITRADERKEQVMRSFQSKKKGVGRAGWSVLYHRNTIKDLEKRLAWHQEQVQSVKEPGVLLLALRQFLILRRAADEDDALRDRLEQQLDNPTLENR